MEIPGSIDNNFGTNISRMITILAPIFSESINFGNDITGMNQMDAALPPFLFLSFFAEDPQYNNDASSDNDTDILLSCTCPVASLVDPSHIH